MSIFKAPKMPPPPKPRVMLTPSGSMAKEDPKVQEKRRRGKKATILTSNSGLTNTDEDSYKPSLLG